MSTFDNFLSFDAWLLDAYFNTKGRSACIVDNHLITKDPSAKKPLKVRKAPKWLIKAKRWKEVRGHG